MTWCSFHWNVDCIFSSKLDLLNLTCIIFNSIQKHWHQRQILVAPVVTTGSNICDDLPRINHHIRTNHKYACHSNLYLSAYVYFMWYIKLLLYVGSKQWLCFVVRVFELYCFQILIKYTILPCRVEFSFLAVALNVSYMSGEITV